MQQMPTSPLATMMSLTQRSAPGESVFGNSARVNLYAEVVEELESTRAMLRGSQTARASVSGLRNSTIGIADHAPKFRHNCPHYPTDGCYSLWRALLDTGWTTSGSRRGDSARSIVCGMVEVESYAAIAQAVSGQEPPKLQQLVTSLATTSLELTCEFINICRRKHGQYWLIHPHQGSLGWGAVRYFSQPLGKQTLGVRPSKNSLRGDTARRTALGAGPESVNRFDATKPPCRMP